MRNTRKDLLTPALFAILIFLVLFAGLSGFAAYRSIYDESISTIHQKNLVLINRIDGWLKIKEQLINYSAKLVRESELPLEMFDTFFDAVILASDDVSEIILFHSHEITDENEMFYRLAEENPGKALFYPPFYDYTRECFLFGLVRTVNYRDTSSGVITILIMLDSLVNFVNEHSILGSALSFILDNYGYIILGPDDIYSPFSATDMTIYEHSPDDDLEEISPLLADIFRDGYASSQGMVYVGAELTTTGWYVITRVQTEFILENSTMTLIGIGATVLLASIGLIGGWIYFKSVKRAMEKVRVTEEKSKLLIEAMPLACFLLNSEYRPTECNRTAVELFAIGESKSGKTVFEPLSCNNNCSLCAMRGKEYCKAREQLVKNYRYIIFGTDDEKADEYIVKQCSIALENGINYFEHEHYTLMGEMIPCNISIVPVDYLNEAAFAVYVQDIRPIRAAREASRLKEIAEEENKAKTRFLAKMSHEIRTPLNSVMGIAEIELRKAIHPEHTEQAFLRILSSSRLLLSIINDILDLAKVEAGTIEILTGEYETTDFIMDTIELNVSKHEKNDIDFKLKVGENLPSFLIGDALRVKQIINNLLSNAFKYTKAGEVSLSLDSMEFSNELVELIITVTDTGRGMSEDELQALFTEFRRFKVEKDTQTEGTGLGMAIVWNLIKLMNGDVKATSEVGVGTSIVVRIPQTKIGKDAIGEEAAKMLESLDYSKRKRSVLDLVEIGKLEGGHILVVDDVEANLEVMQGILSLYGISAETISTGAEAVERITNGETFDIIFMDHMMPGMDGIEATKIIRSLGYELPIIALSANADKETVNLFLKSGFNGFVGKPIDIDRLNGYLRRYLHE